MFWEWEHDGHQCTAELITNRKDRSQRRLVVTGVRSQFVKRHPGLSEQRRKRKTESVTLRSDRVANFDEAASGVLKACGRDWNGQAVVESS